MDISEGPSSSKETNASAAEKTGEGDDVITETRKAVSETVQTAAAAALAAAAVKAKVCFFV